MLTTADITVKQIQLQTLCELLYCAEVMKGKVHTSILQEMLKRAGEQEGLLPIPFPPLYNVNLQIKTVFIFHNSLQLCNL